MSTKNDVTIETAEPVDFDIPMSSEALRVWAEIETPTRVEDVARTIANLKPKVEKTVAANLEQAAAHVGADARVAELKAAGQRVREIHLAYERERTAKEPEIQRDRRLTATGKGEALRKMADARDAKLADVRAKVQRQAELARLWYAEPRAPHLSQAAISKGNLYLAVFPHAPADVALADLAQWVDTATSTGVADDARNEAIALLYHVARPLLARRSISPEKHAEPFQRQYREMAGMVNELIDSWGERPHRRIATGFADLAEQHFTFIVNMGAQHGWDGSLEQATADFFTW